MLGLPELIVIVSLMGLIAGIVLMAILIKKMRKRSRAPQEKP